MEIQKDIFPNLPERIKGMGDLAENLWWSWHPSARMLFKRISRQGWKEHSHNPDKMLKEVPRELLDAALNGVPHLSIPDGWWIEAYNDKNGWIFGRRESSPDRDHEDAQALYDISRGNLTLPRLCDFFYFYSNIICLIWSSHLLPQMGLS